jgi:creatinine amidohydrolase/Fe(II)-dependent formamide hydrolase-like protein
MRSSGKNETSIMMALHPDLVNLEQVDDNPIGAVPLDPRTASPEFGEQDLTLQLDHMTHTLERVLKALDEQTA